MRTLHELEKRADRHRQQALKKIQALEQEHIQDDEDRSGLNSRIRRENPDSTKLIETKLVEKS